MARRGVLTAAVIVRPPQRFPDRGVVAIGGRRRRRRPDASVGLSPGLSSRATRQESRRDGAEDDIDIDIDIDINFQPTNHGDGGILLPRRGRRLTRQQQEVAGAGLTHWSGDCPACPPGLHDEDVGGTGPTTTSTSTSASTSTSTLTSDQLTVGTAGSSSPDVADATHDDDEKWRAPD
jgi:hypothetical protein